MACWWEKGFCPAVAPFVNTTEPAKKNNMNKKKYETPEVTLMECHVEKGFAGSATAPQQMEGLHETQNNYGDEIFS